ncbi:MAG: hypothetical protein JKY37_02315, partial [Nannocystaceae bacterium]|nr:hypothetical protein [Nannocystaceae bacterium]
MTQPRRIAPTSPRHLLSSLLFVGGCSLAALTTTACSDDGLASGQTGTETGTGGGDDGGDDGNGDGGDDGRDDGGSGDGS